MSRLRLLDLPPDRMEGEVVAVPFYEDERPLAGAAALPDWRLDGALTAMLLGGEAVGRAGENVLVQSNGKIEADWVLFVGAGLKDGSDESAYRSLVRHILLICLGAGFTRIALCLEIPAEMDEEGTEKMVSEVTEEVDGDSSLCLSFHHRHTINLIQGDN